LYLLLTDCSQPLDPGPCCSILVPAATVKKGLRNDGTSRYKPRRWRNEQVKVVGQGGGSRWWGSLVWRCSLLAGFARNIEKAPRSMSSRGLFLRSSVFCPISRGAWVCRSAALDPRCRFTSRSIPTSHIASCNQLRQHAEFP